MASEDMIVVGYDGTVPETGGRDASWLRTAAGLMPSRSFTLSPRL
jgi:hypothetical protein